MRAYELHACAKQVQRSSGRSSVAAAAYRAGALLHDERMGLTHDYTRKRGVEHTQIFLPENAPEAFKDRGLLWNGAESKENRKNSCTARELELGFPAEFNAMQRLECGTAICHELMRRYGCAVDIAYHEPDRGGDDDRNHHGHIMFTTRGFDPSTKDGWAKTKYRDFNNDKATDENGKPTTRGKLEVASLRSFVAQEMNRIAERDKLQVKTEHLSFEKRGIDKEPTQKMGPTATQMERRGEQTERGDINREITTSNDNRYQLEEKAKVISLELERIKREQAKEQERIREAKRAEALKAKQQRALEQAKKSQQIKDQLEDKHNQLRAAFESDRDFKRIEFERKQDRLKTALQHDQQQRNSAWLEQNESDKQHLQERLKVQGIKKVMRDMIGATKRDNEALEAVQSNITSCRQRMVEEKRAMEVRQQKEAETLNQEWRAKEQALELRFKQAFEAKRKTEQKQAKDSKLKTQAPQQKPRTVKPEFKRTAQVVKPPPDKVVSNDNDRLSALKEKYKTAASGQSQQNKVKDFKQAMKDRQNKGLSRER